MERNYITKRITINVDFNSDFTPPAKYEEANNSNHYKSACSGCPFYYWEDDSAYNDCLIGGYNECPIKKYF